MGPAYLLQWAKYCDMKKIQIELDAVKAELTATEKHHETIYPLLRVLETAGFLEPFEDPATSDLKLTQLGVLATELNEGNPLLMAYAFNEGLCDTLSGEEILCFLCAFLNEGRETGPILSAVQIPSEVRNTLYRLDGLLDVFFDAEKRNGVVSPSGFWSLNSYWIEPVWRWINGETISRVCEDYELFEGNFMRVVMKVSNLLEEFTSLATFTQNVEMLAKLEGLSAKLVRDVAVPESLYLRI
jgi:superfamily II RNA helicase